MTRLLLTVAVLAQLCGSAGAQDTLAVVPLTCGLRDAVLADARTQFGGVPVAKAQIGAKQGVAFELIIGPDAIWATAMTRQMQDGELWTCIYFAGHKWTGTAELPGKGA